VAADAQVKLSEKFSPPDQRGEKLHRISCIVAPGRAMHEQLYHNVKRITFFFLKFYQILPQSLQKLLTAHAVL